MDGFFNIFREVWEEGLLGIGLTELFISIGILVPCVSSLWDSLLGSPRRGLYQIFPLWGVSGLRENHLGASRSTETAKRLCSSYANRPLKPSK